MTLYYDKDGKSLSFQEFITLFRNENYRRIELDSSDEYTVSTIWLGIDHNLDFEFTTPIIFETMVFGKGRESLECLRAATLEEAKENHSRIAQEYGFRTTRFSRMQL